MIDITITNEEINFSNNGSYNPGILSIVKDEQGVWAEVQSLLGVNVKRLIAGDTTINGVLCNTSDELEQALLPYIKQ